jgi:NodT family efflux transporter outer membrane factor (OMF) lipoprotein
MLIRILTFLLLVQACAPSLPVKKDKSLPLPPSYPEDTSEAPADGISPETVWKDFFQDPKLNELINTSLANNQELHILEQEINVANNEIMARQGEYWPRFSANASGGVEKVERFSTEDANRTTKFQRYGASATWEIDIWKKLRNATKSAYYEFLASVEGRRFLVTNLVAEVANTYFELMALDNQLEIVEDYIKILEKITGFVQLQKGAGRVTSLPVKRFEAEVLKNKGKKFELRQQITITQNKLNTLLGRFPHKIKRDSKLFAKFTLSRISSSVPVKLLENRPDVKRASLELEASKLNVDVARARFYPSLSIDGEAGYERFNSKHFVDPVTDPFYMIAANISMPLLNRKAIKADYFSANNKQIQAIYHYEKALIDAYTDVVNQLNTIKNYDSVYEMKSKQVEALQQSIEISNTLFKAARVDYVEALLTQRDALEAQVELVEVKKQQLSAYVNLYKALGGGWRGVDQKIESNY